MSFNSGTQEFRIELKPINNPLGFICVYNKRGNEVFLEAIGIEYSIPFDPLRLPEYMKKKNGD